LTAVAFFLGDFLGEAFFLGGMPPKPIYAHKRRAGGRAGRSVSRGRAGWAAMGVGVARGLTGAGEGTTRTRLAGAGNGGTRTRKCSRSSSAERADREHLGVYEDGATGWRVEMSPLLPALCFRVLPSLRGGVYLDVLGYSVFPSRLPLIKR
jgi:hypothetical protein